MRELVTISFILFNFQFEIRTLRPTTRKAWKWDNVFFYPRNRKVQGMVFNSFSPFKHFFTPKMVETLSLCIYEKSIQFIIPFTFHIHNAIRHYCIFSFFIVCHLLGAYHYVRKKRLLEHKARVQPRSIPLRQKEQRYLIITYGKANILRGESNSSVVSKNSEQHCCGLKN